MPISLNVINLMYFRQFSQMPSYTDLAFANCWFFLGYFLPIIRSILPKPRFIMMGFGHGEFQCNNQ